jgi:hypothetical protein
LLEFAVVSCKVFTEPLPGVEAMAGQFVRDAEAVRLFVPRNV